MSASTSASPSAASLAVETSRSTYSVTLTRGGERSSDRTSRFDADFDGIAGLVRRVLAAADCPVSDVEAIAVNSGPGNLTSVRAGLSYVNGLSFATGAPVHYASTLEVLAFLAEGEAAGRPVLVAHPARGAQSSISYLGLFGAQGAPSFWFGPVEEAAERLAGLPEVVVAGANRRYALGGLAGLALHDSGVDAASSDGLAAMLDAGRLQLATAPVAPVTEESALFAQPA
ncbi:tRNA (adenosine(37)-N6)-threonylcarbamoyltransferase complex dimerization subunit type 1 TsaB [Motilibacter deserti]|uniref:tRNA (Adenosine(37)-N6)-threonylcarbamoyltransferase complex dimerization subunit type 1 TsaB n=1 Tax=Motilibacter deserti TaxID=2714956 RepID=A0ABX0GUR1_9ACTN|nr:tRNA (adenosine(37)-N6)-threonylcarbamoyltransferase complex dimerization subunit type 1 TsaB [Motilibacter deserti]NHC13385.1 tRNA (adenosine(37)-N6)-threonylcarbamoyltransferase complex dimerization subunit type 1 TsaB [Motilibacter deserti]